MPNLRSPAISLRAAKDYRQEILQCYGNEKFTPYMTLFFRDYSRQELLAAKKQLATVVSMQS